MNSHPQLGIYIDKKTGRVVRIASPESQIENMVFGGGGVKEIATVGVVRALQEAFVLPYVKRVAGSSAGAITAMFLALGCNAGEIEKYNEEIKLSKLVKSVPKAGMKLELLKNWLTKSSVADPRLDDGSRLSNKIQDIISNEISKVKNHPEVKKILDGTSPRDITFKQLEDIRKLEIPGTSFRELTVTGVKLTKDANGKYKAEKEYFNASKTPDMTIAEAIRESTSIPYYFKALGNKNVYHIDGGVLNNLPMDVFAADLDKTLGVRIDTEADSKNVLFQYNEIEKQNRNFVRKLFDKLRDKITHAPASEAIRQMDRDTYEKHGLRTLSVPDQGVQETDFDVSDKKKNKMISVAHNKSRDWVRDYLDGGSYENFSDMCSNLAYQDLVNLRAQLKNGVMQLVVVDLKEGEKIPHQGEVLKDAAQENYLVIVDKYIASRQQALHRVDESKSDAPGKAR